MHGAAKTMTYRLVAPSRRRLLVRAPQGTTSFPPCGLPREPVFSHQPTWARRCLSAVCHPRWAVNTAPVARNDGARRRHGSGNMAPEWKNKVAPGNTFSKTEPRATRLRVSDVVSKPSFSCRGGLEKGGLTVNIFDAVLAQRHGTQAMAPPW